VRIKVYGDYRELIEKILQLIDENFVCIISPILDSDRGGYHTFATIKEVRE